MKFIFNFSLTSVAVYAAEPFTNEFDCLITEPINNNRRSRKHKGYSCDCSFTVSDEVAKSESFIPIAL